MVLFKLGRLGDFELPNRLIMAPLARARSLEPNREPPERVVTYYRQRATAGLIISEAGHVAADSVSRPGGSGMHTDGHMLAWRKVTAAVHEAGGRIFQQLFHLGRKAHPTRLPHNAIPVAPSPIAARGEVPTPKGPQPWPVPRQLRNSEIELLFETFRNAIYLSKVAGFDGVEIHAANGFLIDQFLRDGTNRRTDAYGGTIVNRSRFLLEIVDTAIGIFGPGRVGVRISPHFVQDGIQDSDPTGLFGYVADQLDKREIAYLHLIESDAVPSGQRLAATLRRRFRGALILAEGYTQESATKAIAEQRADFVAFGALFIANPDLVERFRHGAMLNSPDTTTFYNGDEQGYIDYPFLTEGETRVPRR
jgi:N-ethylmaleimide reductase